MFRTVTTILLFLGSSVYGQVLTTAETVGKGKQVVTLSGNLLVEPDDRIGVFYGMYQRGVSSRVDLYVGLGETQVSGKRQAWVGVGENAKLFSIGKSSFSVFTFASIPLHRFNQACTVLFNPALIVSRPLTKRLSVYTGVNSFIPIGARSRGFFTPNKNRFNVPVGSSIEFGNWSLALEGDVGKLKAIGFGLSKSF